MNSSIGAISKWKYLLILKILCFRALFVVNPVVKPEYFIFYGEIWDPEP